MGTKWLRSPRPRSGDRGYPVARYAFRAERIRRVAWLAANLAPFLHAEHEGYLVLITLRALRVMQVPSISDLGIRPFKPCHWRESGVRSGRAGHDGNLSDHGQDECRGDRRDQSTDQRVIRRDSEIAIGGEKVTSVLPATGADDDHQHSCLYRWPRFG